MFSIDPMIFEMKKYMKQKKKTNKNMINAFSLKFKIGGGGGGSEVPKTSILSLILSIYLN